MLNFWFVLLNIIFLGIDFGTMFVWFFFFFEKQHWYNVSTLKLQIIFS